MGVNTRQNADGGMSLVEDISGREVMRVFPNGICGNNSPGVPAHALLRIAANVADTETVTVDGQVYEFDTNASITAGRILVDVSAAQTPTAATTALAAAINANSTTFEARRISANIIILLRRIGLNSATLAALATAGTMAETMAGANNVVDNAGSGLTQGPIRSVLLTRVPTAAEVTLGTLYVPLHFTPRAAIVAVRVTSTGVIKAWDGALTFDATNNCVVMDNAGSTDWAATDTLSLIHI